MRIRSIYFDVWYVYIIHCWCVPHIMTLLCQHVRLLPSQHMQFLLNQQLICTFESYHVPACYLLTYHAVCDSILCGYFNEWHSSQQLHGSWWCWLHPGSWGHHWHKEGHLWMPISHLTGKDINEKWGEKLHKFNSVWSAVLWYCGGILWSRWEFVFQ